MRRIQLKRGSRVVTEIDLYDLLVLGDKSKDAPLLPGDVIYFPPVGPLAALSGSVNNPAIFELKDETSLAQLLRWAGGLTTTAQTQSAQIERIRERKARVVEQFASDEAGLKKPIRDGDLVTVFPISPKFENAVTLRANNEPRATTHEPRPTSHDPRVTYHDPRTTSMRIRDLIPGQEALITPDYDARNNLLARAAVQPQSSTLSPQSSQETKLDWVVFMRALRLVHLRPMFLCERLARARDWEAQ